MKCTFAQIVVILFVVAQHCLFGNIAVAERFQFPADIHIIEKEAFSGNKSIDSVELPYGVQRIDSRAFADCALNEIQLPETLIFIADDAFEGCSDFIATVAEGTYALEWCLENDVAVSIKDPLEHFEWTVLNDKEAAITAYHGTEAVVRVPAEVDGLTITFIDSYAFNNNENLRAVIFPDCLVNIGSYAFSGCTNLRTIELPEGTISIGNYAFERCESFTEINLPDGIEELGACAFSNCINLTKINIPVSWESTGWLSGPIFNNCKKLISITVPEGMEKLPDSAFYGCTYIEEVVLPSTLKFIGSSAFAGCTGIKDIDIPDQVTDIGEYAFDGCTNLRTIELPEGTISIGNYAFRECTSFTEIRLPDSIVDLGIGCFVNCRNLESINVPVNWSTINGADYYAGAIWGGCEKLTSIVVPEGMERLPNAAFYGCTYIEEVVLPSTLKFIGSSAFAGCAGIKDIDIPDQVTYLGSRAFSNCENLVRLYIPVSVNSIDYYCFEYSNNLKIFCEYGSYALRYAIDNNIPYYYLSLVNYWLPSGTIYMGDENHISGLIRSSDPIINAEAKLYNASGDVLRSGTVNNDSTIVSLGVYLDGCISLATLPIGTYSIEISAATEEEAETFAYLSFDVARPPLRLNLTGASVPGGLYRIGETFELKGTIQSNYMITSITAGVYDHDGLPTDMVMTVTPYTSTYDLSNLAGTAQIDQLKDGKYSYQIRVTSDGITKTLKKSSFGMGTAGGDGIKDEELAQMLVFGANPQNKLIFAPLTYHQTYLDSLNDWEFLQVLLISGKDIVIQQFGDWILKNQYSSYAVDLYKAHIAKAIESQNDSNYVGPGDFKLAKLVSKWMENTGNAMYLGLKAYMEEAEPLYGQDFSAVTYAGAIMMSEMVDTLGNIKDDTENLADICKYVEQLFKEYEEGADIIDSVVDMIGVTDNVNFDEAVRQVRMEYTDSFLALGKTVLQDGIEKVIKGLLDKALAGIVGKGRLSALGVAKWLIFETSGLEEHSDNTMAFVTASEAFHHAERAYKNAFDLVYAGDQSEEALRRLLICFKFAYDCADDLYHTIYDISPISKKAEVLERINEDLKPIKFWN